MPRLYILSLSLLLASCSRGSTPPATPTSTRNVLLITIDTLRADRVGAYGYGAARTPTLDGLARAGVRFDAAYAAAPITLTSHASIMTGRYPPGHGARHNGIRVDPATPTIAETLARHDFATAAFVAAFPLDRRFGLIKGFQTYGDRMPRGNDGRPANERPGRAVADEAIAWLNEHRQQRFFVWVHFFEPHAPYGQAFERTRPMSARYDDEIAEADNQAGRVVAALGDARAETLIVAAADHGEAFGEHGEISHSVFTYDTTLRVPLIVAGPGVAVGQVSEDAVSLVDLAPTIAARTGGPAFDADGIDLSPALGASALKARALYAESFAPLFDFGWSPLRTLREGRWKYVAAPKAELYDLERDPEELENVIDTEASRASELARRVDAISPATLASNGAAIDRDALARLQALGYASGRPTPAGDRPDPKDRKALAARLAEVTSGELQGAALERALRDILKQDPNNPQAHVRLGYVLSAQAKCPQAIAEFRAAIAEHLPSVDAHLGLAGCAMSAGDRETAARTLKQAASLEPDNPVVLANLGIALSDGGHPAEGVPPLERALSLDPDLHQGRFSLAIAFARLGRRADAAREAEELLRRLPANAPQRPEVARLLAAVRP